MLIKRIVINRDKKIVVRNVFRYIWL